MPLPKITLEDKVTHASLCSLFKIAEKCGEEVEALGMFFAPTCRSLTSATFVFRCPACALIIEAPEHRRSLDVYPVAACIPSLRRKD